MTNLTNRERQILKLSSQGESGKKIAVFLKIKKETVKFHLNSIRQKLNAKNTLHAVVISLSHGLLE